MSQILVALKRKISRVERLRSVVKMMKNLSAARVAPFRKAADAMDNYDKMVRLGFQACLKTSETLRDYLRLAPPEPGGVGVVVFGSDRGMVGQFNEIVTDFAVNTIRSFPGDKVIFAMGEKIHEKLHDRFPKMAPPLPLPHGVDGMPDFIANLVTEIEKEREKKAIGPVYVIYNRLTSPFSFEPVAQQILPLQFAKTQPDWPTRQIPQVIGQTVSTFSQLLREYIFVSFYKACAESLESENASRLALMQEAEQNIDKLTDDLRKLYFHERQRAIDEELFDIVSGFESTRKKGE